GYYFFPFLNIWKPYQAMREIWCASASPHHWQKQMRPSLVPIWWTLWLASNMIGNLEFRLSLNAKGLNQLITSNGVALASDCIEIVLDVLFIILIREIYRMQMEAHSRPSVPDLRDAVTVPS